MSLEQLCAPWPEIRLEGQRDVRIDSVVIDSRRVRSGALFVAMRGRQFDGHAFVPAAVGAGCSAVAVARDQRLHLDLDVTAGRPPAVVEVELTEGLPARLARRLHHRPDESLLTAGVTGTNGKTTVAFLLQVMLTALVGPCGLLGTVRYEDGRDVQAAPLTTPSGPDLYGLLARMATNGCRAVAMELSSHALQQDRAADLALDVAVLTNLGRDHLDYHQDRGAYLAAKARILNLLRPARQRDKQAGAVALNGADPAFTGLDVMGLRTVRFAARPLPAGSEPVDLQMIECRLTRSGTDLVLRHAGGMVRLSSRLVGRFNAENLTAALAAGMALGFDPEPCAEALAGADQVPGRLERFVLPSGGLAVVDYAHTPDALAAVLGTCRELTKGSVLVVFGCGGDRDQGKRPLMGEVAANTADRVWITSDNPRSEDPAAICEQIAAGCRSAGKSRASSCEIIVDRPAAMAAGLAAAGPLDIVVIAGKGHEDYQLIGERRLPLDDRRIVRDWIARRSAHV